MKSVQKDLSYFTIRLREHLDVSYPELSNDTGFINHRSRLATNAYEGAFMAGNRMELCNEIADYILFENLYFSKFDTVFRVVCNEFCTIMADEGLRPFAVKMLTVCEPVFSQYTLSEEFADSPECALLYTELTGTIQIWIEENGLQ